MQPMLYIAALWATLFTFVNERAEAEEVIFSDIRLMGADLIDEMVYQWQESPPLGGLGDQTALVLVGVQAPLGLDMRFKELVENRLFELLRQNPKIPVNLAYCGPCRQWVAKSNPTGTVLGWAMDQPEVLQDLLTATPERYGLVLDFEAEAQELVLRAQIFSLAGHQKIMWARTLATSSTARRALREDTPLISLNAARKQQQQILDRRDPLEVISRIAVRVFRNGDNASLTAIPLPFFEQSFEVVPLPQRNLRSAITFGFTSIQESLSAWSVGGHLAGLILRDQPSLINPDLYWLVGAHYVRLRGPGAAVFGAKQIDIDTIRNIQREPKATFVTWRLGIETHIKHRLGLMMFLEDIPLLKKNEAFDQDYFLGIPYLAYGFGVLIKW